MKVIFVASGNKAVGQVNSFVRSQFDSLEKAGLDMWLFPVVGHGVWAHLRAVWNLRQLIRRERPDIVHAHYSIYGHVAWLALLGLCHRPKIIVSILGSFPTHSKKWRLVRFCIQHLWDGILVKSERTRAQLGFDLPIIPNGVNTGIFYPVSDSEREEMKGRVFGENKKYIIWCSNPEREEKNWPLAEEAVELYNAQCTMHNAQLVAVYNKTPQEVAAYMNAADCLLLTSMSEGSPNVIKEAMACNCPIVTTDVGDVQERLRDLDGCYITQTEHEITSSAAHTLYHAEVAQDIAQLLRKALDFGQRTMGYERIMQDGLTIDEIAKRIIQLYNNL